MRPILLAYVVAALLVVARIIDVPWAALHLGGAIAGVTAWWQAVRYAGLCGIEERRIYGAPLDRWDEEDE